MLFNLVNGFKDIKILEHKNIFRGEKGIRTPGAFRHSGFQDRCAKDAKSLPDKEVTDFEKLLKLCQISFGNLKNSST